MPQEWKVEIVCFCSWRTSMGMPLSGATMSSTSPPFAGGRQRDRAATVLDNVLLFLIPAPLNMVTSHVWGLNIGPLAGSSVSLIGIWLHTSSSSGFFQRSSDLGAKSGWLWWTGRPRGTSKWARTPYSSLTARGWRTMCAAWLITSAPLLRLAGSVGWRQYGTSILNNTYIVLSILHTIKLLLLNIELRRSTRFLGQPRPRRMRWRCRWVVVNGVWVVGGQCQALR